MDNINIEDFKNKFKEALNELINRDVFVIVAVGYNYVQFVKKRKDIIIEAASRNYIPEIENLDNDFLEIHFNLESDGNYSKLIPISDFNIDEIINESVYIFSKIYKVEIKNYEFKIEI